jgi:hypothetical protein
MTRYYFKRLFIGASSMPIKFSSTLRRFASPCLITMSLLMLTQTAAAETLDLGDYAAPDVISYGNSFTGPQNQFTDWFGFSVLDASYNGISASISFAQVFGIDQLTTQLYSGSITGDHVNVGSFIAAGNSRQTTYGNATQTISVIDPTYVAGDYLLKISGLTTGEFGGSYAGIANLAPVPLPPTLPLMAAGLGILALIKRKRDIKCDLA